MTNKDQVIEGGQSLPSDLYNAPRFPYTTFRPNGEQWTFKKDRTMVITKNGKLIAIVESNYDLVYLSSFDSGVPNPYPIPNDVS